MATISEDIKLWDFFSSEYFEFFADTKNPKTISKLKISIQIQIGVYNGVCNSKKNSHSLA